MILPRTYETDKEKYKHFNGKPKLSISQHTSWKDPEYVYDYIVQYFSGIKMPDGIWACFGGEVGQYKEHHAQDLEHPEYTMLSAEDKEFLQSLPYPANCLYEDEVVLDLGDFCVQGFLDKAEYFSETEVGIEDTKTGNLIKKKEYYGSDEYSQTIFYAYVKIQEGFTVIYCRVELLGRKGNNMTIKGKFYPIKLSGEVEMIDTPYSEDRAKKILEDLKQTAKEIDYSYSIFRKYFK